MDVDRLMRDRTVEELENIQANLEKEMEGKREGLREMVGRRYRDVLEASSEVRNVCDLAEKLAAEVANARTTHLPSHIKTGSRDEQRASERFYALHYLLANIGDNDELDDAFAMLLVEFLHKQLVTHHSSSKIYKAACAFTNRIVSTRSQLEEDLVETLGEVSRSDWVINQLAGIAILQFKDLDNLLEIYLQKRHEYIVRLINDSSSILSIVEEIKKTLSVVEEVFLLGELQHVIQSISNGHYRSELIGDMCFDQAFHFERVIREDVEKIVRGIRERKTSVAVSGQRIQDACTAWIEKVCAVTHPVVAEVCEYYENTDQVIELLQAISNSLKQDWPRVGPSNIAYERLLQTVVLDKLKELLNQWVEKIEKKVRHDVSQINDGPSTSVFDERAYRLNSSAHIGVSNGLVACVKNIWLELEKIGDKCSQYETICSSMNDYTSAASLKSCLADLVHAFLMRLCDENEQKLETPWKKELSRARLALALVHSDASLACSLLDKDSRRINAVNQRLHSVVEHSLGLVYHIDKSVERRLLVLENQQVGERIDMWKMTRFSGT
ncbi:unnamed protein product [Caenorhabditis auriculariae]|uniref:Conserved oligomeric Golgi complex subunit 1 n=1 Tax=Caenorhabditis auriculariae TaxID=2777116 RepID=A0A8S1H3L8_9PELO|nr:unnamed protein product [Caenorhabditis auriculariae]